MNIAINGFGRIGRQALRIILEKHPDLNVVLINDLTDPYNAQKSRDQDAAGIDDPFQQLILVILTYKLIEFFYQYVLSSVHFF
jgi:homoserine dehydrogenase